MQTCWTVAHRPEARPTARKEHVAQFVDSHALSSSGAPTDHRLLPRAGEEAASVDRQALLRRAEAAAKSAALRYNEVCGGTVRCTFVGQPRDEGLDALSLSDIETDPQAWLFPRWMGRVPLAFKWDIFERESVIPTESDFSVVELGNAERQGVPLPASWESLLGALADSVSKAKGAY